MEKKNIIIASDHAGLMLKQKLVKWLSKYYEVNDLGPDIFIGNDSYVDYAKKGVSEFVESKNENKVLILVCGSGVGMSIVANRQKGIRAVLAYSKIEAKQGRNHNDCNCLCLGGRNVGFLKAKCIVKTFLNEDFLGGKHLERINNID